MQLTGKFLICTGAALIIVGALFLASDRFPFLKMLGRLPGDIAIEKENFRFYFPLTTSILLSLVLTALLWLYRKF